MAPFGLSDLNAIPPRPVAVRQAGTPQASAPAVVDVPPPAHVPAPPPRPHVDIAPAIDMDVAEERRPFRKLQVAGERPHFVSGASTLRLERNHDGTLQFLPGRLEVVEGREVGQEIRFVRTPGPDGATVTFGRSEGAEYRHVQLHEPTVSRLHAKLVLDGRAWSLVNLSRTNPVAVNGLALSGEGSSVILRDGDRIEMGEVVFRFRVK